MSSPASTGTTQGVSELVERIRSTVEGELSSVAVVGEISNLATPASGHLYFHLKDERAVLRTVLFRGSAQGLRFQPENGLSVLARGRVSVYPARGDLQLIAESLEPEGLGALAKAFEQLKERLAAEGLFDAARKRALPSLPRRIGIVTSRTGSVIRDIVHVARRRHPRVDLLLAPVRVQGEGAAAEIASAVERLGESGWVDVIVVARGGGSLEDLWAFNEEQLARAIVACPVPVVSAVGHETDFTIADFVADLRAPTPSAAAELVVPERRALAEEIARSERGLEAGLLRRVARARESLERTRPRPVMLERALADRRQRVDDQSARAERALLGRLAIERERLGRTADRMQTLMRSRLVTVRAQQEALDARCAALDPSAAVARGYALVRPVGGGALIRGPSEVEVGEDLDLQLARGHIAVRVIDRGPAT